MEKLHAIALPHLQSSLQTSPHNLYRDTSSVDQENFYKQARCVYIIQTVHESLSFLYVVSYFFAQPSFDSSSPYTAQQRVN